MAKKSNPVIEYRVYDLPFDIPAIVLTGENWRISDEISERLHFHNCTEIGLCRAGEGTMLFEGGKHSFSAGDVTIIPRYVPHTTYSRKGSRSLWSYVFADFEELLRSRRQGEDFSRPYVFGAQEHPRVQFLSHYIFEEIRDKRQDSEALLRDVSATLITEVSRLAGTDNHGNMARTFALKPALEFIRSHYAEPVKIKELSDLCHLSETHFRRQFLSIMGDSPLGFLRDTRIKHACALLRTTEMSMLEVADAVGVTSFSNFNRTFKAITGLCPRDFRKLKDKGDFSLKQRRIVTYKGWMTAEERPAHVARDAEE